MEKPRRIEAMLFLYFVALMIVGLLERNIRKNMQQEKIEKLRILPNGMKTATPTLNNINNFFRNVHLSVISNKNSTLSSSIKGVTDTHEQVLRLLKVPELVYSNLKNNWWDFAVP